MCCVCFEFILISHDAASLNARVIPSSSPSPSPSYKRSWSQRHSTPQSTRRALGIPAATTSHIVCPCAATSIEHQYALPHTPLASTAKYKSRNAAYGWGRRGGGRYGVRHQTAGAFGPGAQRRGGAGAACRPITREPSAASTRGGVPIPCMATTRASCHASDHMQPPPRPGVSTVGGRVVGEATRAVGRG